MEEYVSISRGYFVHFHIPGMNDDYCGRIIPSAAAAIKRVRKLTRTYGFRITKIQERKGKNTRDIDLGELEELCRSQDSNLGTH